MCCCDSKSGPLPMPPDDLEHLARSPLPSPAGPASRVSVAMLPSTLR